MAGKLLCQIVFARARNSFSGTEKTSSLAEKRFAIWLRCQMRGLSPGDIDPETGPKVRLHIGHIVDKSLGGKDELSNLRTLCSTCNQGAKNITIEKPTTIWLLGQIRRAGQDEQMAVYKWLRGKFGG